MTGTITQKASSGRVALDPGICFHHSLKSQAPDGVWHLLASVALASSKAKQASQARGPRKEKGTKGRRWGEGGMGSGGEGVRSGQGHTGTHEFYASGTLWLWPLRNMFAFIALHWFALRCNALHYFALLGIAFHCFALLCIAFALHLQCCALLCTVLHCFALDLQCFAWLCIGLYCICIAFAMLALLCTVLHCFALDLHCFALLCIALHCICIAFAVLCVALHCFALLCIGFAMLCMALHLFALHLHCICSAVHCFVLLHCIALHCFALLCIAFPLHLHCCALLCTVLHCFALHLEFFAWLCTAWHCVALLCNVLHCFALLCIALFCSIALLCIALQCFALLCIALHCHTMLCLRYFALLCIALHCFAFLSPERPSKPARQEAHERKKAPKGGGEVMVVGGVRGGRGWATWKWGWVLPRTHRHTWIPCIILQSAWQKSQADHPGEPQQNKASLILLQLLWPKIPTAIFALDKYWHCAGANCFPCLLQFLISICCIIPCGWRLPSCEPWWWDFACVRYWALGLALLQLPSLIYEYAFCTIAIWKSTCGACSLYFAIIYLLVQKFC